MKLNMDDLRRNKAFKLLGRIMRIEILYIIAAIILTGGLVNYLLEGVSVPATTLITKSSHTQSFMETMVYTLSAALGVLGGYMVYRSSQASKTGRESGMVFLTGAIILFMSFALVFGFWSIKLTG